MIQFLDAWRFISDILIDIVGKQFGCLFFYCAVLFDRFRIAAEKISEHHMAMQLLGILGAYVQMVCLQMRLIQIFECLSVLDTKITFVDISDRFQSISYRRKYRIILDDHIDIDTRLGRHTFDGSASDVLNTNDQVANRFLDLTFYFLESRLPSDVVWQYNNPSCTHIGHLSILVDFRMDRRFCLCMQSADVTRSRSYVRRRHLRWR